MFKRVSSIHLENLSRLNEVLPTWEINSCIMQKEFRFERQKEAWDFVDLTQKAARRWNCPPQLNFYLNTVQVYFYLQTQSTKNQVQLASFMDKAETHIKSNLEDF